MVPPLSELSLALCHEALEGGGNHKMESQNGNQHRKKKLPLLIAKAINSLPHKSFRFCSPMQNIWCQQLENQ